MLEISIALVILVGAAALFGRPPSTVVDDYDDKTLVDLPCPWCRAATDEDDEACPSCHHPFALIG
jgi:hypothetical protein